MIFHLISLFELTYSKAIYFNFYGKWPTRFSVLHIYHDICIPTANSEKPCGKIGFLEDLEIEERTPTLVTRSLPRRCLSVEGATNNRSGMNQTARPASVFLEMDNPRRLPTSSRSRRPRNYYISINVFHNSAKKGVRRKMDFNSIFDDQYAYIFMPLTILS